MGVDDYADALWRLLPPGPAWSRDDPDLAGWVLVAARRLAAVDAAVQQLALEADPRSAQASLPAWERSLGFPVAADEVTGRVLPDDERRARVVQRLLDMGGQRLAGYYSLARVLGYQPAVLEPLVSRRIARAGSARAGQVLASTRVMPPPPGRVEFRRLEPLVSGFESGMECAPPAARFSFEVRYTPQAGGVSPAELIQKVQRVAHAQSVPVFRSLYAQD